MKQTLRRLLRVVVVTLHDADWALPVIMVIHIEGVNDNMASINVSFSIKIAISPRRIALLCNLTSPSRQSAHGCNLKSIVRHMNHKLILLVRCDSVQLVFMNEAYKSIQIAYQIKLAERL